MGRLRNGWSLRREKDMSREGVDGDDSDRGLRVVK